MAKMYFQLTGNYWSLLVIVLAIIVSSIYMIGNHRTQLALMDKMIHLTGKPKRKHRRNNDKQIEYKFGDAVSYYNND